MLGGVQVADKAAGLSFEESLEVALRQKDWEESEHHQGDDCSGEVTAEERERRARRRQEATEALQWGDKVPVDETFCRDGKHHFLVPSFFKTLTELTKRGREFTAVIRTFGVDISEVVDAINAFAQGRHPWASCRYEGCGDLVLPLSRVWQGRYGDGQNVLDKPEDLQGNREAVFSIRRAELNDSAEEVYGLWEEEKVLEAMELKDHERVVVACQDHYLWWRNNGYKPAAGKPLWITEDDTSVHHIFFDDNIHNCSHDSIVAVRWRERKGESFRPMTGEMTRHLHGCHTIRVQSFDAFIDENYFLKRISECEDEWRLRQASKVCEKQS